MFGFRLVCAVIPSRTPRAFALARASLVRSLIRLASCSAKAAMMWIVRSLASGMSQTTNFAPSDDALVSAAQIAEQLLGIPRTQQSAAVAQLAKLENHLISPYKGEDARPDAGRVHHQTLCDLPGTFRIKVEPPG